jgi:hypothetical protein
MSEFAGRDWKDPNLTPISPSGSVFTSEACRRKSHDAVWCDAAPYITASETIEALL